MMKPDTALGAAQPGRSCMNRRDFLILGGTAVSVPATFGDGALARQLVTSSYARKKIGTVSALKQAGAAIPFSYPTDDIENVLVMLDEEAGAGVGEGRNIVATGVMGLFFGHSRNPTGISPLPRSSSTTGGRIRSSSTNV